MHFEKLKRKHFTAPVNEREILAYKTCNSRGIRPVLKAVALIVALVFLFEQTVFSQGQGRVSAVQPVTPDTRINLNQFSIPRDIAITKDISKTSSEELIINIKDVHDNYGAQESIVDILENLLVNYDIRFVGVEGSEGYIDTSVISAFPDEKAKKLAADYMLRRGKLSAGEFFAALSETPITLYGIDDSDLYVKNYYAFLNLIEYKNQNLKFVEGLKKALTALESHVFSEELKILNNNSVLNGNGNKRFTKRWDCVKELGQKYGIKLDAYPNINALMKAVKLEKAIDYDATNSERDVLLDTLTKTLPKNRLEEFVLKSLAFKLEKISKSQFYSYLLILAKAENIDKSYYKHLENFSEYVTLYESIDLAGLMDEIDDYECKIREKLFRNNEERALTKLLKDTVILHNLYSIRLTSGQLKYLKNHIDNFKALEFLDFIKEEYDKYNMPLPADLSDSMQIFERLPEAITFYEAATARNTKMVENTIKKMKENNVSAAAIITGGFHSRGITDILKSDKISYLVLLPRFNTKNGKRPYITILTNKASEYKEYVDSGEYLAVTSHHPEIMKILTSIGMENISFIEKQEIIGNLLGTYFYDRSQDGYKIDKRGVEKIIEMLPSLILQKKIEEQKTRGEKITPETIEQIKQSSDYKFLEKVIASAIVIVDENTGRVNVYLESEEAGRCMYSVKVIEAKEGEKEQLDIKVFKNVTQKAFEEAKFFQSLQSAKDAAERAIIEGTALSDKVQNQLMSELQKKVELYLQDLVATYGDKLNLSEELDEATITTLAGRIGIKKGDPLIQRFISENKDLMIASARAQISDTTKEVETAVTAKQVETKIPVVSTGETAETGYSMKRLGTDEDTGEKVRHFFKPERIIAYEKKAEKVPETKIHGMPAKVVRTYLGEISMGHQFIASDGKTLIIVVNANPIFLKKMAATANVTEKEILEETLFHEAREAFWISKGYSALQAHRIAWVEQITYFSKGLELTPYQRSELARMTIQELSNLIEENRTEHLNFFKNSTDPEIHKLADSAEEYETLLKNEAKLERFRKRCNNLDNNLTPYLKNLQSNIDKLNTELSKINRLPGKLLPKLKQRKDDLEEQIAKIKKTINEKIEQFNSYKEDIAGIEQDNEKQRITRFDTHLKTVRRMLDDFERDLTAEISRDLDVEKAQKKAIPVITSIIKNIKNSRDAAKKLYDRMITELLHEHTDPDNIKWINIEFQHKINSVEVMIKNVKEEIKKHFPAGKMQSERKKCEKQCNELLAEIETYKSMIKTAVKDAALKEELNSLVKQTQLNKNTVQTKLDELAEKLRTPGFEPNMPEIKKELQEPINALSKNILQLKEKSNELLTDEIRAMFQTVINKLSLDLKHFRNLNIGSIYRQNLLRQEVNTRTEDARKAAKEAQEKFDKIKKKLADPKLSAKKIAKL
ncbi:MAG: hypothetical protein ABIH09_00460, partial [Candidatus Omnitrophota bacterium]